MITQTHHVRFFRCVDDPGAHRAVCSCGWAIMGDPEHVRSRAATHDIDAEHELEQKREEGRRALLNRNNGFVSGLPDW